MFLHTQRLLLSDSSCVRTLGLSLGAYSGSTGKIVGNGKWVFVAVGGLSGGVVGAVGAGLSSEMAPAFADFLHRTSRAAIENALFVKK
ncbi:MAG: hypothetical protein EOO27_27650 [Comamonadaceae bacterium]|nr:MAG: hypothetical protein EOO27_27650 [Comamonadaceae bacterium]